MTCDQDADCTQSPSCPRSSRFPAAAQDRAWDWGGAGSDLEERGALPPIQQSCLCYKVKLRESNRKGGRLTSPKGKGGKAQKSGIKYFQRAELQEDIHR